MKKTITPREHMQLIGLKKLADDHLRYLEDIERSMYEVLGMANNGGHISDICYGRDQSLEWALKGLGVTVLEPAPRGPVRGKR